METVDNRATQNNNAAACRRFKKKEPSCLLKESAPVLFPSTSKA